MSTLSRHQKIEKILLNRFPEYDYIVKNIPLFLLDDDDMARAIDKNRDFILQFKLNLQSLSVQAIDLEFQKRVWRCNYFGCQGECRKTKN